MQTRLLRPDSWNLSGAGWRTTDDNLKQRHQYCFSSRASVRLSGWFPPTERARAMGIFLMGAEVGTALTPLLVIPIQQHYGWRPSFFVLGLIGGGWVVAWRRWYHDRPSDSPRISQSVLNEIGRTTGNGEHALPWRSALRSRIFGRYFFLVSRTVTASTSSSSGYQHI